MNVILGKRFLMVRVKRLMLGSETSREMDIHLGLRKVPSIFMNGLASRSMLGILVAIATFPVRAEIQTVALDEVSVPTRGEIDGGFTAHEHGYAFGSMEEDHGGLWLTDGTTLGTRQILDEEVAGPKISASPYLFYWVEKDLYRTNGIPGQRTLIQEAFGDPPDHDDFLIGSRGSTAYWLKRVGSNWEVWQSRGQENDAVVFKTITRGGAPAFAGLMASSEDWLVFLAPDFETRTTGLWTVDPSGSLRLLDTGLLTTLRPFFSASAGHAYYTKRDDGQIRLFRTDGTEANTGRVSSAEEVDYRNPAYFLVSGETVYFQANDTAHGTELWSVGADGVAKLQSDVLAGRNSGSPEPLAVFQESVWAMARNGGGSRLWQIPLNDSEVPSRVEGLDDSIDNHYVHEAHAAGDFLFLLSGPSKNSPERWLTRTDGTSGETEVLEDGWFTEQEATDAGWPYLYPLPGTVLFPSFKLATGVEPYAWDVDEDEPTLVKDAHSTPITGARAALLQGTPGSDDIQYFTITAEDETELRRLRSNGTIQVLRNKDAIDFGYSLTANFKTGTTFFVDRKGLWSLLPNASSPSLIYANNTARPEVTARHMPFTTTGVGILFQASVTGGVSFNIYHSDGILGGNTVLFGQFQTYFGVPVNYDGLTYYVVREGAFPLQPRITNGLAFDRIFPFAFRAPVAVLGKTRSHLYFSENSTIWAYSDGKVPVSAGAPASVSPLVVPPAADDEDRLFYIGRDARHDELWVTDGTVDGAERLTDLQELNETGGIIQLTTIDDVLFFAAKEEATGFELWRSEGTEDETMRLTDLNVGEEDSLSDTSDIPMMGALGTHVYFAADDGVHGTELWRVHKSGAPVELVQDLVPGPGASNPHNFTLINGRLFFQATDPSRQLTVLREIVDRPGGNVADAKVQLTVVGDTVELRFGSDVIVPYFLLESEDLMNWKVIESYSGFGQQLVQRPLSQVAGHYYRLQRN